MSRESRAIAIIAATAVGIAFVAIFWTLALAYTPFAYSYPDHGQQAVQIGRNANGQTTATIHLSIQQTTNRGPHGNWLGYQLQPPGSLQKDPANGVSSGLGSAASARLSKYQYGATEFRIPAHALVTVIVHNYDSQTQLRNPFFTQVQGTVGGIAYDNGKPFTVMNPNLTSHTFTIPLLRVSVPMAGIPGTTGFVTMKFTFRAPGKGTFHWQCIIPCGGGTYGFGDPMGQFGYMNGVFHFV